MLLEEFDDNPNAIINPDIVVTPIKDFPSVTIACFSHVLFDAVLQGFPHEIIAELHSASGIQPIYKINYQNHDFAFFHSLVGEPICVGQYEECLAMGSKRLIILGNCGVLDHTIEDCGIIIPNRAIRDEGTSYHYVAASDTIDVNRKYIPEFIEVLNTFGYPYVIGTTWTTDAMYRETRQKMEKRKKQGAICVEMECAGLQALCQFRNTEFFEFFYAGDNLDHSEWQPRSLSGSVKLDDKVKIVLLAFELGLKMMAKENHNQ